MQVVNVSAENREGSGKSANKVLRNSGKIPAVLYGKDGNSNISVVHNGIKQLIYTSAFKVAEIDVEGKTTKCIVKDVQFHPVTDAIVHVDFLQLSEDTKVKVNLPIKSKGESEAVRAGGKLVATMRKVKVKAFPKDLVDELYVDISNMELGSSVRVKDLEIGEGVEVMSSPNNPVFRVEIPRALKSAEAEAEGAAAKEGAADGAAGDATPAAE